MCAAWSANSSPLSTAAPLLFQWHSCRGKICAPSCFNGILVEEKIARLLDSMAFLSRKNVRAFLGWQIQAKAT
jgi:hypothetical protein